MLSFLVERLGCSTVNMDQDHDGTGWAHEHSPRAPTKQIANSSTKTTNSTRIATPKGPKNKKTPSSSLIDTTVTVLVGPEEINSEFARYFSTTLLIIQGSSDRANQRGRGRGSNARGRRPRSVLAVQWMVI